MDLLDAPADEQAPPSENKVDLAKRNLDDALYDLWDVASDASNTKMNITGKRYTAKDLPKAIQKVMEALVKLGYVKLADISEKLIERMKASENWKDLVDKVTPEMLRKAYDSLPQFDGKQTAAELDGESSASQDPALPKRTVSDLIKAMPVVVKNIIDTGESKNAADMEVLVKRRMRQNPEWRHLESKVTPAMVKQAYAQASGELASRDENKIQPPRKSVLILSRRRLTWSARSARSMVSHPMARSSKDWSMIWSIASKSWTSRLLRSTCSR